MTATAVPSTTELDRLDDAELADRLTEAGRRIGPAPTLAKIRERAARELERLPEPLRRLDPQASYPITISEPLRRLTEETDRRLAQLGAKVS